MNLRQPKIEQVLLLAAMLLAFCLRFFHLGVTPLSDIEATAALRAWQISEGSTLSASYDLGAQPGYTLLTGFLFELTQSTNFMARLLPALAGALLILAPYLIRRQLGRVAAIILVFGLAIDPGLVTVSRVAGGPMPALAFSLLAAGFWHYRRPVVAGIFAGLALLSGPALIAGLIPLGLAWLITRIVFNKTALVADLDDDREELAEDTPQVADAGPMPTSRVQVRNALMALAATVLLVGTLFFRYPQGLGAWMAMIPAYLAGWTETFGIPALRLPATLIFYQPLALIFALVGVLFGLTQRNLRWVLFFTLWLVFTLGLGMLYPSRQVSDLVWAAVPLWGLAAFELKRYLPDRRADVTSLVLAGVVFILMGLFWFTLASMTRAPLGEAAPYSRGLVLLGILVLIILATALVALGWSWKMGRTGLAWGLTLGLTVYLVSVMWGAAQLRFNMPQELWGTPPATGQADLLQVTLDELSWWQYGALNSLEIQSSVDLPSLRWALRSYPNVRYVSQPLPGEQPDVLITAQGAQEPALAASYRGQDFIWSIYPGWEGALPADLLSWFTFRRAPLQLESIILWARNDLFVGQPAQIPDNNATP